MSKLSKMIEQKQLGNPRRIVDKSLLGRMATVNSEMSEMSFVTQKTQVDLGVSLRFRTYVTPNTGSEVMAMNQARRAVVEAVFGEFREPLVEAMVALHDRDFEAAEELISRVLNNMFDTI